MFYENRFNISNYHHNPKTEHPPIPDNTLRNFLNYHQGPNTLTASEAFNIARVHRTTWQRWMNGKAEPPAATMELLRLHAEGRPASGYTKEWNGFFFNRGKLYTPNVRFSYTPQDIMMIPVLYGYKHRLEAILEDYDLQRKLFKEHR